MRAGSVLRVFSELLFVLFLSLYVAAKIDFFTDFQQLGLGPYLREQTRYWAAMAVVAFLIWRIERRFPRTRPRW